MKDNKLTHKFWVRAVAFCLFAVVAAAFAWCLICALYCYNYGWYPQAHDVIYSENAPMLNWLYANRYFAIYLGASCAIVDIMLFVFLLCSSGHKEGEEGIALGWQDRIPLDIYLAVMGIGGLALAIAILELISYGGYLEIGLAIMLCGVFAAICMAICMTLAARFKKGGWWRNTAIHWLWRQIRRFFRWLNRLVTGFFGLFDKVNMSWRYALGFTGFIAVNAILAAGLFAGRGGASVMCFISLVLWNGAGMAALLYCVGQMQRLKAAGAELAAGNLSHQVDTAKLSWDFKVHGESLNSIGEGMGRAVEERIKSERFRTELITNVSHDIKTPLTSIVTYTELLKQEDIANDKAREYIATIDRQSQKLKKLTEDLLEASKASSGAINVNIERVNLSELMRQSLAEYEERLLAAHITPMLNLPGDEAYVKADGRLLWRVFDNLMLNICRHGMAGTRAYLTAERKGGGYIVAFKNISAEPLDMPADELLERFVQGDGSRSKEGSGLGLSIAQSLTELMGGSMELKLDGDLFKAELTFKEYD